MGLQLMPLSAKVQAENRVWLEGLKNNFGVRVSVSSLTDAILSYVRIKIAIGEISLTEDVLQSISRIPSVEKGIPGIPGIPAAHSGPHVVSKGR